MRHLYENRVFCEGYILDAVQRAVRNVRVNNRADGNDVLARRARDFATPGSWGASRIREFGRMLDIGKTPPNTGNWRTIEFECIFRSNTALTTFRSQVRAAKLAQVTTIKHDGSVHRNRTTCYDGCNGANDSEGVPMEIVFSFQKTNEASVTTFCKMLNEHAYVNHSCGTHVHFDMRGSSEAEVTLKGGRIAKYAKILRKMLPAERRNNHYCREDINTPVRGDRYSFVNLQAFPKHGTIEVRAHSGTLNATKILNWIAICDVMMSKRVRATSEISNCLDLALLYDMPRDVRNYMVAREAKFNDAAMGEAEGQNDARIAA